MCIEDYKLPLEREREERNAVRQRKKTQNATIQHQRGYKKKRVKKK